MNLLNILTKALTSSSALKALAAKTGLTEKQLTMIIAIALPLLLRRMTNNASSQSGANSLLGALGQHQNKKSIGAQLEEADEEDGAKIIGHILGDDTPDVVKSVAKETSVSEEDVAKVLGTISPSILSGLSAATASASTQKESGVDLSDGFDMNDVMGLLGGSGGASGAGSLLGSLFGGGGAGGGASMLGSLFGGAKPVEEDQNINGNQLINSLLSLM